MPTERDALSADPTAAIECHIPDDRYVPLRACDLLDALGSEHVRRGGDRIAFERFSHALRDVIEQEAVALDRDLSDQYSFFNPDRDTRPLASDADARSHSGYEAMRESLERLLDKANFERLTDFDVAKVVRAANSHGLRIRLYPDRIVWLSIWLRGRGIAQRTRRSWRRRFRKETVELETFRRLVVAGRLKDDPHILLKMFKDIPEQDIEALLPHAEVEMGLIDRLVMFTGGAGALGSTAMKLFSIISGSLLVISRLLWVLIIGFGTVIFRTFMGYRNARMSRDSQRTRHLYYYNLSNNAGTIHTLVRMIASEELKEAALAYVFCLFRDAAGATTESPARLGARVERFLFDRFGVEVDFDEADAVKTLERLELWEDRAALRTVDIATATQRLEERWRTRRAMRAAASADASEMIHNEIAVS